MQNKPIIYQPGVVPQEIYSGVPSFMGLPVAKTAEDVKILILPLWAYRGKADVPMADSHPVLWRRKRSAAYRQDIQVTFLTMILIHLTI